MTDQNSHGSKLSLKIDQSKLSNLLNFSMNKFLLSLHNKHSQTIIQSGQHAKAHGYDFCHNLECSMKSRINCFLNINLYFILSLIFIINLKFTNLLYCNSPNLILQLSLKHFYWWYLKKKISALIYCLIFLVQLGIPK
jgi:hypothetical protein